MEEVELLKIIFKNSPDILEPLNEIDKKIERLQDMDKILRNENINLKLRINKEIERLHSIIKEVREYITSYESIDTIQQTEIPENNIGLDEDTFVEMVRRYMLVHDKLLEILEKVEGNK